MACELSDGRRPLPGGLIYRTTYWLVEHCIGPLGLGALIVKPERHVTAVADLTEAESGELEQLLQRTSAVARDLVGADQVYNCLWSHAGGVPVHIHYVVQPVTSDQTAQYGAHGPALQVAMFANNQNPEPAEVERIAELARQGFVGGRSAHHIMEKSRSRTASDTVQLTLQDNPQVPAWDGLQAHSDVDLSSISTVDLAQAPRRCQVGSVPQWHRRLQLRGPSWAARHMLRFLNVSTIRQAPPACWLPSPSTRRNWHSH